MPTLSTAQRTSVAHEVMRRLSAARVTTDDVLKAQIISLIGDMDDALDTAESTVVAGLPNPGNVRTWVLANQTTARRVLEVVQESRRLLL